MNRRDFIKRGSITLGALALGVSVRPKYKTLHGDGIRDDLPALQALVDGEAVWDLRGSAWIGDHTGGVHLRPGVYRLSEPLRYGPQAA